VIALLIPHFQVALWISDASEGASREGIGQVFQEKLQPVNLSDNPYGGAVVSAQFSFDTHSDSFRRYAVGTQQRQRMQSSNPHPEVAVHSTPIT